MAKSRHLVDAQLLEHLGVIPHLKFTRKALPQIRQGMAQTLEQQKDALALPPGIACTQRTVPGPKQAPDVRVAIYSPEDGKIGRPAYLHIHGGAVEDCYAALKWLHANAATLGVDRNRLAIGGESAGGGLAAALALLTRDRKRIKLTHQQLVYPMLEDRPHKKPHPYTGEFIWDRRSNVFGWTSLLGQKPGGFRISPYAAPARATNLKGLPPAFISVGAMDLFLDEDMDYAMRLTRAGVPVELHVYPGAYHGFYYAAEARVTRQASRDQMEALRVAFARR
jgi:acetyl esterase/lipase